MTKRHFVRLARMVRELPVYTELTTDVGTVQLSSHCDIAEALADVLAEENPRFDRDRFLLECDTVPDV